MSACVWPTFFTGTLPGHHGQYFPIQWDPASMELKHVDSSWLDCEPFWRPLARAGLPVTTLDVQMTFPSRTPDGVESSMGVEDPGRFLATTGVGKQIESLLTHVLNPTSRSRKAPSDPRSSARRSLPE